MEIVLLWLDDLDDLVICCARLWEPLRSFLLQVGLGASFALCAAELSWFPQWADVFALIAAGSVGVWLASAAYAAAAWLRTVRRPALA